jgi:hypothetical protein
MVFQLHSVLVYAFDNDKLGIQLHRCPHFPFEPLQLRSRISRSDTVTAQRTRPSLE